MPTYEYKCTLCKRKIELNYYTKDKQYCDKCGGELKRVIQGAPVVFKARGFTRRGA